MHRPKVVAIIPARYASVRLPGKPLVDIAGKSMIRRVYDQVNKCASIHSVIIATDDQRVADHVKEWGGIAVMTGQHNSGTDRIAEVAATLTCDIVVNVQGDEPMIDPSHIKVLVDELASDQAVSIATLCTPITSSADLFDYNQVKVVRAATGDALYFSRQAIPAHRDLPYRSWLDNYTYYGHIGVYAYRRDTLLDIVRLPMSSLEQTESLEQLRWLEAGYVVRLLEVDAKGIGVDTQADLDRVRGMMS